MPERHPPDDPREWLNRAGSDLEIARSQKDARSQKEGIYFEDLCFRLAEKVVRWAQGRIGGDV